MAVAKIPFIYYGGKAKMADLIVSLMKPHRTYVELFGGAAAVLLNKPPSEVEVYNEIDSGVTNFFNVIRDRDACNELFRRLTLTPYSRKEYYTCLETWNKCTDPIEKARRWYFVQATSFNGRFGAGLRSSATKSVRGRALGPNIFQTSYGRLFETAHRFKDVMIDNQDFREAIKRYDTSETLFYADPPYVHATRTKGSTYVNEIDLTAHEDLVNMALASKGMWVISGYEHPVYEPLTANGWTKHTHETIATSAGYNPARSKQRTEVIWVSP